MDNHTDNEDCPARLEKTGKKLIATMAAFSGINLTLLLAVAGDWRWPHAWVLCSFTLVFQMTLAAIMANVNPALLNERGKFVRKDTKGFDKVFFKSYFLLLYSMMIVAALDSGRFGWSFVPVVATTAAYAVMLPTYAFAFWAMLTNTHFETTVRIQHDRGHKVITTGPYAIIRHPGYLATAIILLLCPLLLGSLWAYCASVPAVVVLLVRTALEDRTLREELEGYLDYTQRVKYRIQPLVW